MFFQLPRHEISLSNLKFFDLRVAWNIDHFHAVTKRRGNPFDIVCGSYENHMAQVERQVQVTINKLVVLTWIQHFQKGAGRIAADVCSNLIDLVQHQDRVTNA
jgi:hypothetical protein